jgi:acyl-CoA synthetase (AMP-forming)/AMP-acid ligase II
MAIAWPAFRDINRNMLSEHDRAYDAIAAFLTQKGQPFETTTALVRGKETVVYASAPHTLRDYFMAGLQFGDRDFLIYQDERYSFAQTYAKALHYGSAFQSQFGVAKGDRVAIAMRNFPDWVFAFIGLITIGAVVVPLNAWWKPDEISYGLSHSGAQLVIADEERARRIASIAGSAPLLTVVRTSHQVAAELGAVVFEDILASAPPQPHYLPPLDPEDDATLLYTSGSTGNPKGAVSTHLGGVHGVMGLLQAGATNLMLDQKNGVATGSHPIALLAVPLFHVTGSHAVFMASVASGRTLVFMHKWDAGDAMQLIEKEKITYFVGVPTQSYEILNHPEREKYDLSSLRDVGAGGAPRPPEHVKRIVDTFKDKRPGIGYGMTETNALSVVNFGPGYLEKPASTGRIIKPITQMKIALDDAGTEAKTGEVGEIWWGGAALIRGYWRNPQATSEAFTHDGWFKSGDMGYFDDEGYLFIVDRKKELIIRGGENIAPVEVEAALYAHPAVAEAAVFGIPDERLGEIVAAVVYPRAGERLTTDSLIAFVEGRLAAFKVPTKMWIVTDPLPRLGTGKIDKVSL